MTTTGSEARDEAEPGGASPPPPPSEAATVVITVSSLETERSVGIVVDPKVCKADAAGGRKHQGKGLSCVAVDLGGMDGSCEHEKVCRICHLSPDRGEEESELIQLGCGCKDDLGIAHRHCAEAWFRLKGNRCCEICGADAKNITGKEDVSFMEAWHEGRVSSGGHISSSERGGGGCWRDQPFCNFLMVCLVIAFILPWFFRVNVF